MFVDFWKGRTVRRLSWFLLLGIVLGLLGSGGCSSDSSTSGTPAGKGKRSPTAGRDLLNPAIAMMQPDHLGIDANPSQPAGLLNQWRNVQRELDEKDRLSDPLSADTRKRLEADLSAEAVKKAERDTFTQEDAKHVRTSMLMKDIVDHVAKGVDGELNRAQVAFDYVSRNVQLVSDEKALPLSPYEIMVFGQGTAADRAWIFAELLRQLNQDAVIVKPDSGDSSESAAWFVGAVANEKIYLYDPLRSTPVPTNLQAKVEDILPATLDDLAKPAVFERLTGGEKTTLSPQLFAKVRLELIGSSFLWSPRMANLQGQLTGNDAVVISQKLAGKPKDSASILNRLLSLPHSRWNPNQVRLWSHPETRLEQYEAIGPMSEQWKPFEAPQMMKLDPDTREMVLGRFSKLQLRTRTEQLLGEDKMAIQGYLRVQLAYRNLASQVPGETRTLYADAAEDAMFWTGVCQMERDEFADAARKFASYIKQYERFTSSRHGDHCRILLARCAIQLGQTSQAAKALKPLQPASAEYATARFLRHAMGNVEEATSESEPVNSSPLVPGSPPHKPAVAEKPAR